MATVFIIFFKIFDAALIQCAACSRLHAYSELVLFWSVIPEECLNYKYYRKSEMIAQCVVIENIDSYMVLFKNYSNNNQN